MKVKNFPVRVGIASVLALSALVTLIVGLLGILSLRSNNELANQLHVARKPQRGEHVAEPAAEQRCEQTCIEQ